MSLAVTIPISIPVRDKVIQLHEDNITLYQSQVNEIKRRSRSKTQMQWLRSASGIRIPLDESQQSQILNVKEQVINYLTPNKNAEELLKVGRGFGFSKHAYLRVLGRVERFSDEEIVFLGPNPVMGIHPETLEKITQSLIDSDKVKQYAEWKGHPYLNFVFECKYDDDRELDIVVNFETGVFIVTLIVTRETGYFIRELYSLDPKGQFEKKPSP